MYSVSLQGRLQQQTSSLRLRNNEHHYLCDSISSGGTIGHQALIVGGGTPPDSSAKMAGYGRTTSPLHPGPSSLSSLTSSLSVLIC